MSGVYIHAASSWDEADEHFEAFMSVMPERREQLAERVAAAKGPTLELSVGALGPLNEWFISTVLDDPEPAEVDYRPSWTSPPNPLFVPRPDGPRAAPGWLLLLWEQVAVHVGDVMMAQVPGARWVCWRDKRPRHIDNGLPMVDVGVPTGAFDALGCANAGVLRSWSYRGIGPGDPGRPDPGRILEHFNATLDRRQTYLSAHTERWQAAATGPSARRSTASPEA